MLKSKTETVEIPASQLQHGAIYMLESSDLLTGTQHIESRCTVSVYGDEVWFTDVGGEEVSGVPVALLREKDETFVHHDVSVSPDFSEKWQE